MTTLLDPPVPAAAGTGGPVSVHVAEDRLVAHSALRLYAALRERGEPDVFLLEGLEGPGADPGATVLGRGALAELRVVPGRVDLCGRAPLVRAMATVAEDCGLAPQGAVSGADGPVYGYGFTGPEQLWTLLRAVNALFTVVPGGPDGAGADIAGPDGAGTDGGSAGGGYAFGFLATVGYGAAWHMEELPPRTAPEGGWEREPDLVLTLFRQTVWYGGEAAGGAGAPRLLTATSPYFDDPVRPRAARAPEAEELRRAAAALAAGADPLPPVPAAPEPARIRRTVDETVFLDRVERALGHIAVGDIYQIQLGHRIEVETALRPLDVYRRLRERNPSPYMFLVPRGRQTLIGASPEVLFRCDDGELVMRPIAGTAPRSGDADVDAERIAALTASEKEQAEHVMLVDLCRNDIGRVCRPTTLETEGMMTVERFSHVFHLVSTVRGELAAGEDVWSVLRATFPAGTVTGAPKIRAMELIHELEPEPEPRGMYAGGVGLVDTRGWSQLALCIRTVVHDGERYATRSCAGVVADSDPSAEWRETLHKMGAAYWALTGEELLP